MEDKRIMSSFLRVTERAVFENIDQGNISLEVPEPLELYFRVCTRPLSELTRTTLLELRVTEPKFGCYLLLKTVQPSIKGAINFEFGRNILVQVEDHCNIVTICCLYGHVHLRSETEFPALLPVNTVFVLKEPFLKACSENRFVVVVGSPSDFVIVGRSHFLYGDAEALGWREKLHIQGEELASRWKIMGRDLYENGLFQEAAEAYLFALNGIGDIEMNFLLNAELAKVFLALGCYERTIQHSHKAHEIIPFNGNVFHLACIANYELGRFEEAKAYVEMLRGFSESRVTTLSVIVCPEDRLREAEGNVNISKLYLSCQTNITTPIDHGNFCRYIEIRRGPGNVRGVFSTQDIEPGTLIMVEKAIVAIFLPDSSSERGLFNFIRTALRAVLKNPKTLCSKLYGLPGGVSLTEENKRIFCDEANELEPILDVRILYQMIQKNILKTKNDLVPNPPFSYQLYELATWFQHSCVSNCTFVVYKDVITIRTCTHVLKGQELFLRFYGNHLSFREKQDEFERMGFSCTCFLCALDKSETVEVHDLRQELKTKFYTQMALCASSPHTAEHNLLPIVMELEQTYRNRNSLHLLLFFVYCDLAKAVDRNRQDWKRKVTVYVEMGLRSVNLSIYVLLSWAEEVNPYIPQWILVPDVLFEYAALMAEIESSNGRPNLIVKWVKVLFHMERVYRGGNLNMLLQRFSNFREVRSLLSAFARHVV